MATTLSLHMHFHSCEFIPIYYILSILVTEGDNEWPISEISQSKLNYFPTRDFISKTISIPRHSVFHSHAAQGWTLVRLRRTGTSFRLCIGKSNASMWIPLHQRNSENQVYIKTNINDIPELTYVKMRFSHQAPATSVHFNQGSAGNGLSPCLGGRWRSRGRPIITWYPHSLWTISRIKPKLRRESTESVIDRGNYANREEDAIEEWSATGNGDEEVTDDERCVNNR